METCRVLLKRECGGRMEFDSWVVPGYEASYSCVVCGSKSVRRFNPGLLDRFLIYLGLA